MLNVPLDTVISEMLYA